MLRLLKAIHKFFMPEFHPRWWERSCEHCKARVNCLGFCNHPTCKGNGSGAIEKTLANVWERQKAERKPLPEVPPPAPPPVPSKQGIGRYYFESQKISICVDRNSEVTINAPLGVSVQVVGNTINIGDVKPSPKLPAPPRPTITCTCFSDNCDHRKNPDHVSNRFKK